MAKKKNRFPNSPDFLNLNLKLGFGFHKRPKCPRRKCHRIERFEWLEFHFLRNLMKLVSAGVSEWLEVMNFDLKLDLDRKNSEWILNLKICPLKY